MLGDVTIERGGDAISRNRTISVYVEGVEHPVYTDDTVYECTDEGIIAEMFGSDFDNDEAVMETLEVMGIFQDAGVSYIEGEMRCEFDDE